MSDPTQPTSTNPTAPARKKLKVGKEFKMQGEGVPEVQPTADQATSDAANAQKSKLKKKSEPFESLHKEKEKLAQDYFDMGDGGATNQTPQVMNIMHQNLYQQQYMMNPMMMNPMTNPMMNPAFAAQFMMNQMPQQMQEQPDQEDHSEHHKQHNSHHKSSHGADHNYSAQGGFHFDIDEEEYQRDPEKYLESLPDDVFTAMKDRFLEEQIDEIINDLEDEEESNPERFVEAMKDCTCCHGYVNKCKSLMCRNLGQCQCMVHSEMESEAVEHFIPECADCTCCHGKVYTCMGQKCKENKVCICFTE